MYQFKQLTNNEKVCLEIANSIRFLRKYGHLANNLYLEYKGDLIHINSEYNRMDLSNDYLKITEDMIYGLYQTKCIQECVEYNNNVKDFIFRKDIVIDYDFLNYEDRLKIQNIIEDYNMSISSVKTI